MRAWFRWGLVVCCAAAARGSWAQDCSTVDPVERTMMDLQRSRERHAGGLTAFDAPAGRSFDVGEIAVLEDNGAGELIYETKREDLTIDIPAIAKRFYQTHPDDYDFLVIFTCFPIVDAVSEASFSAYSMVINNDIRGLHLPDVNYGDDFGSAGNLEQVLNMNNFADDRYNRGPYD